MRDDYERLKSKIFVWLVEYGFENKMHREEMIAILSAFIARESNKVLRKLPKKSKKEQEK